MKSNKLKELLINSKTISFTIIIIVGVLAWVGNQQMKSYEDSILSIYAEQQDAYVQLVLDQINVLDDRSDEEIVTKILGSLDASSRKYWTLTKNKALLFVKDVTETNRYKGLTSNTFFSGDSANDFLQNLAVNKVSHKIIQMGDDRYVASGVIFGYNGARYTICLLTNDTVILDNNSFMASKIGLSVFINGILIILLLSTMVFSILSDIRKNKLAKMKAHTEELNRIVERQTETIKAMDHYHTRWNVYHIQLMDVFVQKLGQRKVTPITLVRLSFASEAAKKQFLERAQVLLDEKIIRFDAEDLGVVLIFIQYRMEEAVQALHRLPGSEEMFNVEETMAKEDEELSLQAVYVQFQKALRERKEKKHA